MSNSMKIKKLIILTVSHILVLCIGFSGSIYYFENVLEKMYASKNSMALISHYSLYTEIQRAEGSLEDYREALLLFNKALDLAKSKKDLFFSETAYKADKVFTNVRLSELEKNWKI